MKTTATRRNAWATMVLAMVALIGLAGCGEPAGDISAAEPASTLGARRSASRTFADAVGAKVTVPVRPDRVIALSEPVLDGALALGVKPIGTTAGRGQKGVSAYLAERAKGVPIVAQVSGANLELVSRLRPDLILVDQTINTDATLGKLRGIAPTVFVSVRGEDWRSALRRLADVLGVRDKGAALLAEYDQKIKGARAKLGTNTGATVSIVRWMPNGPSTLGLGGQAASVISDLGLRRPPSQNKVAPRSIPVSLESLDKIDADWMFFGALGDKATGEKMLAQARKAPGFDRLKATSSRHVVVVDGSAWASSGGPLAVTVVLDDLLTALTSA